MAFSNQALQALEGFAASLQLPLTPAADGSYSFVFERSGTLTLTSTDDGQRTLLSLAARPHRLDEEIEQRLLALAGPDFTSERFLSTGLTRDGEAMFVVSIDDSEISLPTLETCMQQLFAARSAIA
ncbi:hypothetical protein PRN20_04755 [Devosia sp. ZB163]|uniref:hypothetical protein n=1 Tax=Devosia sp. ZB163 TaxID=3025938 RepID=UPI0023607153|nr:hypothetical protein [Devosia sp. ZB163]MDC9823033.1 hypothetical protein [Devosia sp. ZB163]